MSRASVEECQQGAAIKELVNAEFVWREGWAYSLPTGWAGD